MTIYDFKNVSSAYGDNRVLEDLSFSVAPGEFVGILGPNGSGKTTLLKLMAGVLKPTRGSVDLMEKNIRDYSRKELARLVSVLPQETLLDFPFTALEVVLMGRAPYLKTFQWETAHDREVAEAAMEATDCREFAARDVRSLSGGERERILLARALAQKPRVLLLDEPTTHLDLRHQLETHRLLKKLNEREGLTLITVLHDLRFAAQSCGRILMLSQASLRADGPPSDVLVPHTVEEVYGVRLGEYSDSILQGLTP